MKHRQGRPCKRTRRWVRHPAIARPGQGLRGEDVGWEARSLKARKRKWPCTRRVASKAQAKRRLWRSESVPRPRKALGQKQQLGAGVGSSSASGASVKKTRAKCPHNRQRSNRRAFGGSGICEHDRIRSKCKDCGEASICKHNRERHSCKDCQHGQYKKYCKTKIGTRSVCEFVQPVYLIFSDQ